MSYVIKQDINKATLWKNKRMILGRLDMELTERCNNNCVHCYINLPADDLKAKKKELTTDEIKIILREAVDLGCLSVRFTGGEPLLRKDFEEIYIFARQLGLRVMIFTNATLITQRLAELFSRIPPLEKIEVSIYGMKKSSYEAATRLVGSYEKAMRGVDLLLEKNIPFVVKCALLPSNKGEIDEFEKWAAKIPGMDKGPSYSMFFDLRCRRPEPLGASRLGFGAGEDQKNEAIKRLRLAPEEGLEVLSRRKDKYFKEMKEFCSKFMRPAGDELFPCGAGCGGCVDAYGYFQPCMMLRHPDTVYDLKKGSLKDALENFFPEIRKMKTGNREYLDRCAKCFLKGLCEQCPAKSWMEHGTLDTPVEYLCDVAHAQARYLGLVAEDENAWKVKNWKERINRLLRPPAAGSQ